MRAHLVLLLALTGLVAVPSAAAATFDLGASKIIEQPLRPGEDAVFEMPLRVNQDGFLYAKVLPTPGNAVNDGTRANGSVVDGSGWRVSYAMLLPSGERVEMGTYVDSTVSTLVPVAAGDAPTFVATVHVPADAARGGPQQKAYVAIAYRLSDGTNAGANSGGVIDEARALTLLLSNALLPPAEQIAPPATTTGPTPGGEGEGTSTAPTPGGADASGTDAPGDGTAPPTDGTTDAPRDAEESTEVPPVAPIVGGSGVVVQVAAIPTWFLASALVIGAGLLLVLGLLAGSLRELARVRAADIESRAAQAAKPVADAREVPIERPVERNVERTVERGSRVEVRRANEE